MTFLLLGLTVFNIVFTYCLYCLVAHNAKQGNETTNKIKKALEQMVEVIYK